MLNVVFIDYKTLFDNNSVDICKQSFFALKDIANKFDNVKIVCINTKDELQKIFDYSFFVDELSQFLSLKKTKFFDLIELDAWNDASTKISQWISANEVKSFAIVVDGNNIGDIGNAYANNAICCDAFSEAQAKNVCWMLSNYNNAIAKDDDVFFVSDTHFGHANIIKYCNRPWNSGKDEAGNIFVSNDDVERMDNELVKRWNSVVGKNSIVWHLGDFSFGGKSTAERIFPQLNGKINLVMGNHDHYKISWYYELGFHRVYDKTVIINDFVILSHAPLMFLNDNTPFFNVFGHIHTSDIYQTWTKHSCCVCVERHDYTPVSWYKIKETYDMMNS